MELDQSKLNSILMELDVLHKSQSPYIVDFYGAFFIETCVYYCMEFMDAGSLDKLYQIGVPEDILATITLSVTFFLRFVTTFVQVDRNKREDPCTCRRRWSRGEI